MIYLIQTLTDCGWLTVARVTGDHHAAIFAAQAYRADGIITRIQPVAIEVA